MSALIDKMIDCRPHKWRALKGGDGSGVLLLHGAGASADSLRAIGEILSKQFHVLAPDLPGHGNTRLGQSRRSGVREMAADIATLCEHENFQPIAVVGHSAGGALALALSDHLSPRGHILINPALTGFSGAAGLFFPLMAKALTLVPFASNTLARNVGDRARLRRLLEQTGSKITPEIFQRYQALATSPQHIDGTLRMMAAWDLSQVDLSIPRPHTTVILGQSDGTVDPASSERILAGKGHTVHRLEGGHLIHEEQPETVAKLIFRALSETDVPAGTRQP